MGPFLNGARALALLAFGAAADITRAEDPTLTEEMFLGEVPLILTATRLAQPPAEVPAAVTVIDRRMIEASGALSLPDLLRLVPGFQVGHVNTNGTAATITYHGLSDAYQRRMQVLIDGRSVYLPLFGGVFWPDLPIALEDIDRIEVTRGPNGVTYGANAFSAIINIITRTPAQDSGAFVSYTQGDNDTTQAVARYAGGSGDYRYRFTAGYQADDGYDSERYPDDRRTRFFNYRGDWRMDARNSLDLQLGYLAGPRVRGSTDSPASSPIRNREVDSNFQQLRWRRSLGAEEEVSVNFYRDSRRVADTYPVILPGPLGTTSNSEDVTTERDDLELMHILRAGTDHRIAWGAETRLDSIKASGYFNTTEVIESRLQRLFANDEWRFAQAWTANLGAMYEHTDLTGGDWSPRLAVNHVFAPNQSWRAVYSRAWRVPSFIESYGNYQICSQVLPLCQTLILGNEDLNPERIVSREIGYNATLAERTLGLDVKIYREEVRDIIPIANVGGVIGFRNEGQADTRGWETQINWRPFTGTQLVLAHAYAEQHGSILAVLTPLSYEETDASTPTRTTSLMVVQQLPANIEVSATMYQVSNMRWLDFSNPSDETGDIRTLDARLAWRFHANGMRGGLAFIGQNLLDAYYDYWKHFMLGRRYFVNLNLEFN